MKKYLIYDIFHYIITLFVFFVVLFLICLKIFELSKLKYYIVILLYIIAVNILFLEVSFNDISSSEISFSFNQYRGEIGSFYNQLASQITQLAICLFNTLTSVDKNIMFVFWFILS